MKAAFFLIATLACIVVATAYPHDDQETNAVYESLAVENEGSSSLTQSAYAAPAGKGAAQGKGQKGKGAGKGKGKGKGTTAAPM